MTDIGNWFGQAMRDARPQNYSPTFAGCPLVLDLDGDGIELSALNSAGAVYFDLDNDGLKEASAWIAGGDGFLALDRNGNGTIDNRSELFDDTAVHANGFLNLKSFDSNNDNKITSADSQWNNLRVWVDSNNDGVSQATELKTLPSLGITSINTNYTDVNYQIAGNNVQQESTFTINGQSRKVVDVLLNYDRANSEYAGDYTLDVRTLFMPTLRGYGDLPDLHIAMSKDPALLNMVSTLAAASVADAQNAAFNYKGKLQAILYQWAGVQNVNPGSASFDMQKLAFMEKYLGQDFGPYGPTSASSVSLNNAWNKIIETVGIRLLAQSPELPPGIYDPLTDKIADDSNIYVATLSPYVPAINGVAGKNDYIYADGLSNSIHGYDGNDLIYGRAGHDSISGEAGNDTIYGETGKDLLWGHDGDDALYGGVEDDQLLGGNGNDIIDGGTGRDHIDGEAGDDTYIFRVGDSAFSPGYSSYYYYYYENIHETATQGFDMVRLIGVNAGDVRLWIGDDHSLYIRYSPTDLLAVMDVNVEKILFDDGTAWNFGSTLGVNLYDTDESHWINGTGNADLIEGRGGYDSVAAGDGNDKIYGGADDDQLEGEGGNDTIEGGAGRDVQLGGLGDDVYVFRVGDSSSANLDFIYEAAGEGTDTIKFIGGILPQNVSLKKNDNEFFYRLKFSATDEIELDYALSAGVTTFTIEKLSFDNGTVLNLADLLAPPPPVYNPTSGNDTINASAAASGVTINLLAGNDIFTGSNYNDNVTAGDGNDTIEGRGGNDILNGGNGTDAVTYASATSAVAVNLTTTTAQVTGGAGSDTITNFENLTGSAFNDTLSGNSGANTIDGGNGNDTIQGGAGNDILNGNAGTDTVTFAAATAAVTVNLVTTTAQATGGAGSDTITNFENLTGSGFNDTLRGNTGNNTLSGGNGNDLLYGNSGNDLLYGGAGTDTLYGEAGNDTLRGEASNDILYGGTGSDIFKFASGSGVDTIKDFKTSESDKLDIKDLLSGYDPVTKAITDFIQITTSGTNSIVKIDANGLTGGIAWTQIATIEGVTGLTDEAALKNSGLLIA